MDGLATGSWKQLPVARGIELPSCPRLVTNIPKIPGLLPDAAQAVSKKSVPFDAMDVFPGTDAREIVGLVFTITPGSAHGQFLPPDKR